MTTSVLVRCDGGAAIGMGHVSRCLALAEELRSRHACTVSFAMRDPEGVGGRAVRADGYAVEPIGAAEPADYGHELHALVAARGAGAVVVDVRDALSVASLDALRGAGVRVAIVDDSSERRLASDLAFYPPVPQVDELDWSGYAGRRFSGWDWVLLRRDFVAERSDRADGGDTEEASAAVDVLVTMGGSDPAGMTEFAIEALNLLPMPLAVQVVIGPAFARRAALVDAIARSTHAVQVVRSPASMAALMRASRMAVAAFGVSAYELAACGVPSVHLGLTPDHARSASAFERERIALNAGVFGAVTPRQVADAAARLVGSAGLRREMAARARSLVDGRGAERVAALIVG